MNTFIVTYSTGIGDEIVEHTIPIKARSRIDFEVEMDAAIDRKAELLVNMEIARRTAPERNYGTVEEWQAWKEHPLVRNMLTLQEEYRKSVNICGRYFAGIDEVDINDFEILSIEEWITQFDIADAMEDKRRWEAAGNMGTN